MTTLTPPASAGLAVRIEDHLDWAAGIARRRARRFGHREGSDEEAEAIAEAHLAVCQLARRFRPDLVPAGGDPGGQFRGWACQSVLTAVTRHMRRLENAGTYSTRREWPERPPVGVIHLSQLQAPLPNEPADEEDSPLPRTAGSVCDTSI